MRVGVLKASALDEDARGGLLQGDVLRVEGDGVLERGDGLHALSLFGLCIGDAASGNAVVGIHVRGELEGGEIGVVSAEGEVKLVERAPERGARRGRFGTPAFARSGAWAGQRLVPRRLAMPPRLRSDP